MRKLLQVLLPFVAVGCGIAGPTGAMGEPGAPGNDGIEGSPGGSCTVVTNDDGSTTIACPDGTSATVTSGEDAQPILIRQTSVPSSDDCPFGAVRFEAGTDDNGDGVLQDSEVDALVTTVCTAGPGVLDVAGDVVVDEALDLAALSSVRTITGDLIIDTDSITELSAVSLVSVSGKLDVAGSANLRSIRFPALTTLGQFVAAQGGSGDPLIAAALNLQEVSFPRLTSCQQFRVGSVFDGETIPLATLSLPVLESVNSMTIVNTQLTEFSLPSKVDAILIMAKC